MLMHEKHWLCTMYNPFGVQHAELKVPAEPGLKPNCLQSKSLFKRFSILQYLRETMEQALEDILAPGKVSWSRSCTI